VELQTCEREEGQEVRKLAGDHDMSERTQERRMCLHFYIIA
jgi:hypothetical protein